jgi:hypothetical protein
MSHVAQRIYREAQHQQHDDDALAAFAVAEYGAGRMLLSEAIRTLRIAGRFEAEIAEVLRAARVAS